MIKSPYTRLAYSSPRIQGYVDGGGQPVGSYELSGISQGQIKLYEKALWNENTMLRFYKPPQKNHGSHSIVNFQNGYAQDTDHIHVGAITIDAIMQAEGMNEAPPLVKLDIEGAEIEVIHYMMNSGIFPFQICVEFDELNKLSQTGFERVSSAHDALENAGYKCIYTDGKSDFLYMRGL